MMVVEEEPLGKPLAAADFQHLGLDENGVQEKQLGGLLVMAVVCQGLVQVKSSWRKKVALQMTSFTTWIYTYEEHYC